MMLVNDSVASYTALLTTINEAIQLMCEGSHEDATVLIQGALDQLSSSA
jgi:hypothetical protein